MGRNARGVRGIKLREGDEVVGMAVVEPGGTLLSVCENGYGKRTAFEEYAAKHRGGYGVINIQTTERNGACVGMIGVRGDDEIMMVTANGMVVRTSMEQVRSIGRNAQGVRMIRLNEGDKLVSLTRIVEQNDQSAELSEPEPDAPLPPEQQDDATS